MQTTTHHVLGVLRGALNRLAVPFFLFSVVLFAFLILSWMLLLPVLTHVEVAGSVSSLEDIRAYKQDLEEDVFEATALRDAYLRQKRGDVFMELLSMKEQEPAVHALLEELALQVRRLSPEQDHVVHIAKWQYLREEGVLRIQGNIANVGPRSMTYLAQFVELLRTMQHVQEVQIERYTRLEDPEVGFMSPFDITLHLS